MKKCILLSILVSLTACSSRLHNLENPDLSMDRKVVGKVRKDPSCGLVVDVISKSNHLKESWYVVNKDQLKLSEGQEITFTYQLSRAPQPAICNTTKVIVAELVP